MLSKEIVLSEIELIPTSIFCDNLIQFVNEHQVLLEENAYFDFSTIVESKANNEEYDEYFYTSWLDLIHSIEFDIYHIQRTESTTQKMEQLYKNTALLYHSPLNKTVFLVQFSMLVIKGNYSDVEVSFIELLSQFMYERNHLFTSYELEYFYLFDANKYFYLFKDQLNIIKLKNIVDSTSNNYIKSFAIYLLQNAYLNTGRYFEVILLYLEGQAVLTEAGCFRRLIYFEGHYAIANMFLGNSNECLKVQLNIIDLCKIYNYTDLLRFQLKQLVWTYLRTNRLIEISQLLPDLMSDEILVQDQSLLSHLVTYYLEIGDHETASTLLNHMSQLTTVYPIYNLLYEYLNLKYEGKDLEYALKSVIDYGNDHYVKEVVGFYTPKLIKILQEKRKYKDIVEYQNKMLNNRIEMF